MDKDYYNLNQKNIDFIDDDYFVEHDDLTTMYDMIDELGLEPVNHEIKYNPSDTIIPGHLNSPITISDAEFVLMLQKAFCKRHKALLKIRDSEKITITINDIKINYHDYYKTWMRDNYKRDQYLDRQLYEKLIRISVQSSYIQIRSLIKNIYNYKDLEKKLDEEEKFIIKELSESWKILGEDFMDMKRVETIKDIICYQKIPHGEFIDLPYIKLDKDITINNIKGQLKNFGSTNIFLCFLDKIQSIFSLKLYWIISDLRGKYSSSIYTEGNRIYNKLKQLRSTMGEDFYKFIAMWEPLMVGYTINDEEDLGFEKLYNETSMEMNKLLKKHNIKEIKIEDLLPIERTDNNIIMFIELTGMSKIFGHPTLDPGKSLDPLREWGKTRPNYNEEVIQKSLGVAKRDFILNYRKKHNKLPNMVNVPKEVDEYFRLKDNRDYVRNNNKKTNEVDHSETINNKNNNKQDRFTSKNNKNYTEIYTNHDLWNTITFAPTLEYDLTIDSTELIRDSAAAPNLSEWTTMYDACAFHHYYNKIPETVSRVSPTRIMTAYLEGHPDDLPKKVAELTLKYWDKEDSIAVICQKEGELKILEGRGFVKQTHHQRLVQTSMEHNISKFFRYVPEQTMTDSEIIEMRKISADVKGLGKNWELINLDLHKWNLKFRHALVTGFGKMLDQLYDLENFYEYNHIWFQRCFVFTNSRLHPPESDENGDPVEGQFGYRNHLGGFEGMRQKLWTWITMSVMKYTADMKDLRIRIMGQGDNQVIIVKYKPEQIKEIIKLRSEFLLNLEENFEHVNLRLKKEETWISKRLHEYGKNRHYKGIAISQGTKKCVKFIPDINDNIKSLMSSLSTINTITESIAKMDTDPDCAFILNQFHILNLLERNGIINKNDEDLDCLALLYHPTDFGGICLSTYFSHFVRGYDDKVNLWIYTFKNIFLMGEKYPICSKLFNKICSLNQFYPKDPNVTDKKLLRLFEDYFSLNIINLPSVEMKVKNISFQFLQNPKFVKNESVSKLFKVNQNQQQMHLVRILKEMKPVYLTLIFELFRNSNYGIAKSLQNKFTNIQTINRIIQQTLNFDFLDMTQINNRVTIKILKDRKRNTFICQRIYQVLKNGTCCTKITEQIRRDNWGLEFMNDTKPLPLCQFHLSTVDDIPVEIYEKLVGVTAKLSAEFAMSSEAHRYHPGPWDGYLGNKTSQKINKPKMDLQTKSAYLKSVQNLYLIYTWLKRIDSENLSSFTLDLIREKQSIIPEMLEISDFSEWCPMNYGGNMVHRFQSIIDSTSALINMLPTMTNHVRYDTNKLRGLTEGGSDYTIHFQLCLIVFSVVLNRMKKIGISDGPSSFIFILTGCDCTKNVTSLDFDIPKYDSRPSHLNENMVDEIQTFRADSIMISQNMLGALLSFYLGSLLGKTIERSHTDTYLNKDLVAKETFNKPNLLSVNDLRFVSFPYLILGILYSCHFLTSALFLKEDLISALSSNISATILCQVLFDSDILNEFMSFLNINVTTHYEGLAFDKMSHLVIDAMIHQVRNYIDEYLKILLKLNFEDVDIVRMRHLLFSLILNNIHKKDSDLEVKGRFDKKEYPLIKKMIMNNSRWRVINIFLRKKLQMRSTIEIVNCKLETALTIWRTKILNEKNTIKDLNREVNFIFKTKDLNKISKMINTYNLNENSSLNFNPHFYRDYYIKILNTINIETEGHVKNVHHLARITGKISSAFSKIYEIVKLFDLDFLKVQSIVSLAEGSGGVLCSLGELFQNATLTYNTLLTTDIDLRENIDQNYPPAYYNSSISVQKRLDTARKDFVLGETDILKPSFLIKFEKFVIRFGIDLITMDAESTVVGNNLIFFKTYLPLIIKHEIKISIFKVFLINLETLKSIQDLIVNLDKRKELTWCIFKPLSSNQNNFEFYVVILNNTKNNDFDKFNWSQSLKKVGDYFNIAQEISLAWTLSKSQLKNENSYSEYTLASLNLKNYFLKDIFDNKYNLILFDKYTNYISENNCCSLFCKKFLFAQIKLFLTIHMMHINENSLLPLIRTSNINDVLYQILKNILFTLFAYSCQGRFRALFQTILSIDINPDLTNFRSSRLQFESLGFFTIDGESNFSDGWNDSKLYFKHYQGKINCHCILKKDTEKKNYDLESLNNFLTSLNSFPIVDVTKSMLDTIFSKLNIVSEDEQ